MTVAAFLATQPLLPLLLLLMCLSLIPTLTTAALISSSSAAAATASTTTTTDQQQHWPIMARHAFTPTECDAIVELYTTQLKRMEDTREADNVSRINRFDIKGKLLQRGDLDWILDRVVSKLVLPILEEEEENDGTFLQDLPLTIPSSSSSSIAGQELKPCIDFTLLHEFNTGMHFGLHVDTKPNDGTHRTYNVNIMLTDPSSYQGGALQVGASILEGLEKGDLYMYPASLPHAVHPLQGGVRYTYVMALKIPLEYQSKQQQQQQQQSYWGRSEERYHGLMGRMGTDLDSRLYLIYAQFLEAMGNRSDSEIDAAYCNSYKATPEAPLYARQFLDHGTMALKDGDALGAENYFKMAVCVDPNLAPVVEGLVHVVHDDKKLFGVVRGTEL